MVTQQVAQQPQSLEGEQLWVLGPLWLVPDQRPEPRFPGAFLVEQRPAGHSPDGLPVSTSTPVKSPLG